MPSYTVNRNKENMDNTHHASSTAGAHNIPLYLEKPKHFKMQNTLFTQIWVGGHDTYLSVSKLLPQWKTTILPVQYPALLRMLLSGCHSLSQVYCFHIQESPYHSITNLYPDHQSLPEYGPVIYHRYYKNKLNKNGGKSRINGELMHNFMELI